MKRNKVISYLSKLSPKELGVLNEEVKHEKRQAKKEQCINVAVACVKAVCLSQEQKDKYEDIRKSLIDLSRSTLKEDFATKQHIKDLEELCESAKELSKATTVSSEDLKSNVEKYGCNFRANENFQLKKENEELKAKVKELSYQDVSYAKCKLERKLESEKLKTEAYKDKASYMIGEIDRLKIEIEELKGCKEHNLLNEIPLDCSDIHSLIQKIRKLNNEYSVSFHYETKFCFFVKTFIVKYRDKTIFKTKVDKLYSKSTITGFLIGLYEQLKQSK